SHGTRPTPPISRPDPGTGTWGWPRRGPEAVELAPWTGHGSGYTTTFQRTPGAEAARDRPPRGVATGRPCPDGGGHQRSVPRPLPVPRGRVVRERDDLGPRDGRRPRE